MNTFDCEFDFFVCAEMRGAEWIARLLLFLLGVSLGVAQKVIGFYKY